MLFSYDAKNDNEEPWTISRRLRWIIWGFVTIRAGIWLVMWLA